MKIKFITAIYNNLYGTELGGRPSRELHYKFSLISLLKMTNADFLCYTSENEIDDLKRFFYDEYKISPEKLQFKTFDLRENKFKNEINEVKNIDEVKQSDRCYEIQYSKFFWWWNEDKSYDYYYWIDAGLSHCGLLPNKYLALEEINTHQRYFESNLFNNNFLNNLIKKTNDKFYIIGKENQKYHWSKTVAEKWYNNYCMDYHIIGGLFGGKPEKWDEIVGLFEDYLYRIIKEDKTLYHEEVILTLIKYNHPELFIMDDFDIWWSKDNKPIELNLDYFNDKKSFFHILEELNYGK